MGIDAIEVPAELTATTGRGPEAHPGVKRTWVVPAYDVLDLGAEAGYAPRHS
jgi:hypothetical protein